MTIDQLNKMTDEEVRVRVAIRMGFRPITDETYCSLWPCKGVTTENSGLMMQPDNDRIGIRPPNYPADLNAAFTLVEKLRGEGWQPQLINYGGKWSVTFGKAHNLWRQAHHESAARAICLSFLAVTEREDG